MADLTETDVWEVGIYQLEQTDPVDAGVGGAGVANKQGLQLANRTGYLKSITDALIAGTLSLVGDPPFLDSSQLLPTTNWVRNNPFRYTGVRRLNATATLTTADLGKLLQVDALANNSQQITLFSVAALAEGESLHIKHESAYPLKWNSAGGSEYFVHDYNQAPQRQVVANSIITHAGDEIVLSRSTTNTLIGVGTPTWIVHIIAGNLSSVGYETLMGFHASFVLIGQITAAGQLVNRADYPRLWNHVNSYLSSQLVSDSTWTGSSAQQHNYSTGNGTTTFRLPNKSVGSNPNLYIGVINF